MHPLANGLHQLESSGRRADHRGSRWIRHDHPRASPHVPLYAPGDWIDIELAERDLPGGKTYSLASAPTEPDLIIAFKEGASRFKAALARLSPRESVVITSTGNSGFLLDKRRPALLIAGGIGIAPFRSMLKEAIDSGSRLDMTLIYSNRKSDFPFKSELDQWQAAHPEMHIEYVTTGAQRRLTKQHIGDLVPDLAQRTCYVAGPPHMVATTDALLHELGVREEDVLADSFDGY